VGKNSQGSRAIAHELPSCQDCARLSLPDASIQTAEGYYDPVSRLRRQVEAAVYRSGAEDIMNILTAEWQR